MKIDISKYYSHPPYIRNGAPCFLCEGRKKLIQFTPEERVRQALIWYLRLKLDVPSDRILVEVPLSRYVKGISGRADIVVIDKKDNPVLVVECKEENSGLTEEAINQAARYDEVLKAGAIFVTTGDEAFFAIKEGNTYKPLSRIPSYKNLTKWKWFTFLSNKPPKFKRPPFLTPIPQTTIDLYIREGWLGEDTPPSLYPIIFNLTGWFFNTRDKIAPTSIHSVNMIEDAGLRRSQFGNSGGGKLFGEYRYFILKDGSGNHQIVSLGIFGAMKTENHPHWGNRKGSTMLVVCVDDYESSHVSLELNMDRYVSLEGEHAVIWHNGTLTVGKNGQAPRQDVIDFIKAHAPSLVKENKVVLGRFSTGVEIKSNQTASTDFLDKLILYALLRDKYRNQAKRKSQALI